MNNNQVIIFIILALVIGALAGYYYAMSKVEAELPLSEEEVLEQVNPFSETNTNTNPFEYVNPFE